MKGKRLVRNDAVVDATLAALGSGINDARPGIAADVLVRLGLTQKGNGAICLLEEGLDEDDGNPAASRGHGNLQVAINMVQRETLIAQLAQCVNDSPLPSRSPKGVLASCVADIMRHKTRVKCLKAELFVWYGQHSMLGSTVHQMQSTIGFRDPAMEKVVPPREAPGRRQFGAIKEDIPFEIMEQENEREWLQEFWEQYHTNPRLSTGFGATASGEDEPWYSATTLESMREQRNQVFAKRNPEGSPEDAHSTMRSTRCMYSTIFPEKPLKSTQTVSSKPRRAPAALVPNPPAFSPPRKKPSWKVGSLSGHRTVRLDRSRPPDISWGNAPMSKTVQPRMRSTGIAALPPIMQTFVEPWRRSEAPSVSGNLPTQRYIRACEKHAVVPALTPFVAGASPYLDCSDRGLSDRDVLALAAVIRSLPQVVSIDFGTNARLTEIGLVPFIQKLFGEPANKTLKSFSLKRCPHVGQVSLAAVAHWIGAPEGAKNLRHLDLSGIPMGMAPQVAMCKAIREHSMLASVYLADTGLGGHAAAKQCVRELLGSESMRALDIGWNMFSGEVFRHLGECLFEKWTLRSLGVANCARSWSQSDSNPVLLFVECLSAANGLARLDLSMNRIDARGALVIEDALEQHKGLQELCVSHNPLGATGLRNLLRLLSRSSSGLVRFVCKECGISMRLATAANSQLLSQTNPSGRYTLELANPCHRAVLRMLYKTCERFNISPDVGFESIKALPGPYQHPGKDERGVWLVPSRGVLDVTFSITSAVECKLATMDEWDFDSFLRRYTVMTSLAPDFHKAVPLLAQWNSITHDEQTLMLAALSKDFRVEYALVAHFCKSCKVLAADALSSLLPCVTGGPHAQYLTSLLVPFPSAYFEYLKRMEAFLGFHPGNPTGRYRLNLGNSPDYVVAERLMLLDRWEAGISQRHGRLDTSQCGDRSQVRNVQLDGQLVREHLAAWSFNGHLPEAGVLELDYVTGMRPPVDAQALDETKFTSFANALTHSETGDSDRIAALRAVSPRLYISSRQLRELLDIFRTSELRIVACVTLYVRVTDIYNEKMFRVRFHESSEFIELLSRLGYAVFFPIVQPERVNVEFDYSVHEQRIVANALLRLSAKEPGDNFPNPRYVDACGVLDPLPQGVPRLWEEFAKMPRGGLFRAPYICAPESRSVATRQSLLKTCGHWETMFSEDDVLWWSALSEAPGDVLELLEFLVSRFPDVHAAFRAIDGPNGNGVIGLRELEAGLRSMKCTKFKGRDEARRIDIIFRYLDPSGEGQVSASEWGVLEQLWRELWLSTMDFQRFLARRFPRSDAFGLDVEAAWECLDADGSGTLTEEEWLSAATKIGYFGPSLPIFRFLDKDDEGKISKEELSALGDFACQRLS